jgi:hypothetical protein
MPILKDGQPYNLKTNNPEWIKDTLEGLGLKAFKKGLVKLIYSPNRCKPDAKNPGKNIQPPYVTVPYEVVEQEDGIDVLWTYYDKAQPKLIDGKMTTVYEPIDTAVFKNKMIDNLEQLFVIKKWSGFCNDSTKPLPTHFIMVEDKEKEARERSNKRAEEAKINGILYLPDTAKSDEELRNAGKAMMLENLDELKPFMLRDHIYMVYGTWGTEKKKEFLAKFDSKEDSTIQILVAECLSAKVVKLEIKPTMAYYFLDQANKRGALICRVTSMPNAKKDLVNFLVGHPEIVEQLKISLEEFKKAA